MTATKFSITLYERPIKELDQREGDRSSKINQSLERYYDALDRERRELRKNFLPAEISLITDCLNGTVFSDAMSVGMLYGEIEDGIQLDKLDEKWEVDGQALVEKLNRLTYTQNLAIIDAVERYWYQIGEDQSPDISKILE